MSRWTDEEVFLLKEHFPTTPKNYMSEEILADRTAEAISRKARRLDLTKEDNFYFKWKVQQQTKPNRNKKLENFIIGFTAGDGTFMKTKNEDRYKFTYKLEMNAPQNREMVNEIKEFFGCGRISEYHRSDYDRDVIRFVVESIPEHVANILPIFERNNIPAEYKRNQYMEWKEDLLDYVESSEDETCRELCEEVINDGV